MCVTVSIKLPRDRKTGEPKKGAKWHLFKIRDRAYDPCYIFRPYQTEKSTSLFLVDEESDWTECIRVDNKNGETELMFVNSALNNTVDAKEGTDKAVSVRSNSSYTEVPNGTVARRVSRTSNLDEAVKAFEEFKFDGCTFVSDGDRCFLIEGSVQQGDKVGIAEFISTTEEITDWLAVRTNHGITNKTAGYQKHDGLGFESSQKRREHAEEFVRKHIFEPSDIMPCIDMMGDESISKNSFLRPRRVKAEVLKDDKIKTKIYTTSAFVMYPTGKLDVKLYDAGIKKINTQKVFSNDFPINLSIAR